MAEVALRPATSADADTVAQIWREGWRDGHLGHVPAALVEVRTPASFLQRAADRVGDTTIAVVDGDIAGFTMVTGDEVEQVYVARSQRGSGVAALLLDDARRRIGDAGHAVAWLAVATGNERARRFYRRSGWTDEGAFDYAASTDSGSTPVPCHRYTARYVLTDPRSCPRYGAAPEPVFLVGLTERLGGRVTAGNSPARAGESPVLLARSHLTCP